MKTATLLFNKLCINSACGENHLAVLLILQFGLGIKMIFRKSKEATGIIQGSLEVGDNSSFYIYRIFILVFLTVRDNIFLLN
jgi:hypothetical protein